MISLRSLVVTILVAFVAPLLACGFLSLIGQFTSWLQINPERGSDSASPEHHQQ
jgi:hypothetical protein